MHCTLVRGVERHAKNAGAIGMADSQSTWREQVTSIASIAVAVAATAPSTLVITVTPRVTIICVPTIVAFVSCIGSEAGLVVTTVVAITGRSSVPFSVPLPV
eukprot:COSAG02_NODE_2806_length_7991_cov_21.891916_10_plen_102_part_00